MKKGRLIYVTGPSGTGIAPSLRKFIDWRVAAGYAPKERAPHIIKLEDRLTALVAEPLYNVLALPKPRLCEHWTRAYDQCLQEAHKHTAEGRDVFLTFHACWYHLQNREYISCIDFARLSQGNSTVDLVLTLIDDIYDVRSRLSETGGLLDCRLADTDLLDVVSKLTLILDWRAFEITLSERVASTLGAAKHILFAVKHPLRTLNALLYDNLKCIYLSHHISSLRRMLTCAQDADRARVVIESINRVADELRHHTVLFEPTTIDELRLHTRAINGTSVILPEVMDRWPKPANDEELLFIPPIDPLPEYGYQRENDATDTVSGRESATSSTLKLTSQILELLSEKIKTHINARDHFLVEQCHAIAVYRPYLFGHEASGVQEEIEYVRRLVEHGYNRLAVVLHTPEDERQRPIRKGQICLKEWNDQNVIKARQVVDKSPSVFKVMLDDLEQQQELWTAIGRADVSVSDIRTKLRLFLRVHQYECTQERDSSALAPNPVQPRDRQATTRAEAFMLKTRLNCLRDLRALDSGHIIEENLTPEMFATRVLDLLV